MNCSDTTPFDTIAIVDTAVTSLHVSAELSTYITSRLSRCLPVNVICTGSDTTTLLGDREAIDTTDSFTSL